MSLTRFRTILDCKTIERFRKYFSVKEIYLQELRRRWGKHADIYRDRPDIARLHVLTRGVEGRNTVDDSTWRDLDMDALFDRLDNTTTAIGRQYLYRQLRTYEPDEDRLRSQNHATTLFQTNSALRENVQLNMWTLRSSNASAITSMLFGEHPQGNFPQLMAWWLATISVTTVGLAALVPSLLWLPILPVVGNFIFSEAYSHKIGRHSVSFVYLRNLLTVAYRLSRIKPSPGIRQFEYLHSHQQEIRRLRAEFRIVGLDSTSEDVMVAQLAYFLNLFCLFDFLIFMRCTRRLLKHHETLTTLYMTVASVDSAISLASYMTAIGHHHCRPTYVETNKMFFEDVTHPLLDDAIPNDFDSLGDSALITGSNMAGKSTFIKAIGTNLILAQSLWLCHARSACVPKIPVLSSIKCSDSLEEGKSYYFAEIEAILRLIKANDVGKPHIFLIDEILHGTNTVERIASAATILDYLSTGNTVMVTTHDVELTQLLTRTIHELTEFSLAP